MKFIKKIKLANLILIIISLTTINFVLLKGNKDNVFTININNFNQTKTIADEVNIFSFLNSQLNNSIFHNYLNGLSKKELLSLYKAIDKKIIELKNQFNSKNNNKNLNINELNTKKGQIYSLFVLLAFRNTLIKYINKFNV